MAIDMHDAYESAVNAADSILSKYNARRLTKGELLGFSSLYSCGWEVVTDLQLDGQDIKIEFVIDDKYPYSLPHLYTKPKLELFKYPHVEENGKLCIFESDYLYDPMDFHHVDVSLFLAYELVRKNISEKNIKDFHDGFLSYWGRYCKGEYKSLSLCDLSNKRSRKIYVAYNSSFGSIFHDAKEDLAQFLTRRNAEKHSIYESVLIYLESPLTPDEYPKNISDLLLMPRKPGVNSNDIYSHLSNGYKTLCGHSSLLITIPTDRGICCAALSFKDKSIGNGFRNMPPLGVFKTRLSQHKAIPTKVTRGDYNWIYGRDHNTHLNNIKDSHVVILGLGSVGSGVLLNLVKSGVNKVTIIDGEKLTTENIHRHALGFLYVNKSKSESLKHFININYPHVDISSHKLNWQYVDDIYKIFDEAHLVISCAADWPSDRQLLDMLSERKINCPVIFGFLEAYASAAHAITVPVGYSGDSFLTAQGQISRQVVSWQSDPRRPLPQCGASFQPYSCTELNYCNSLISEMAISLISGEVMPDNYVHRVWVHDYEKILINGGKINPPYAELLQDSKAKGVILEM